MNVAILIFESFSAFDAVGAYEVLSRIPDTAVRFLASEPGPKRTDTSMLALTADFALSDLPDPEIVVIPGGPGVEAMIADDSVRSWVTRGHGTARWTGAAGAASLLLEACGVNTGGRVVTGANGVEVALALAARISGALRALELERALGYRPMGGRLPAAA
jgi:putative intracellular protease/amidase